MAHQEVLIIEDSEVTRLLLAQAAQSAGSSVEVRVADGGLHALKMLARHQFALIITDLNMPDISGLELINFVKKNPRYRDTPLVVVTSEDSQDIRSHCMLLGADDYHVKPLKSETITEIVRRYLSASSL